MSMIDFTGGRMLGGGANAWTKYVQDNMKPGVTMKQLAAQYRKEKGMIKPKATKPTKATKPKATRAPKTKKQVVDDALYLRERLFPVANSKNKKTNVTMKHLKALGLDTSAMTKQQKQMISKYINMAFKKGRGIGSSVGSIVDSIFGFGQPQMLGKGVGQDLGNRLGTMADNLLNTVGRDFSSRLFGGQALGGYPLGGRSLGGRSLGGSMNADYIGDYMGDGIGSSVGSIVDSIFGFGASEELMRGGFNIADLAPLALAFL